MSGRFARIFLFIYFAVPILLTLAMLLLIIAYQRLVSPFLGSNCRFSPTCSQYFRQSLQKHGLLKGTFRGILRITKCHPWHDGGYDPP
ncbi:MAG: membrane protein insertion efficiency factor YidD [Pirellulaceae bacterium]|nr:membrane protein insertion efficiency factor YidD [Pirellulaceae bacterium]